MKNKILCDPIFGRLLTFLDILENSPDHRTVRRIRKSFDPTNRPPRWKRPLSSALKRATEMTLKGDIAAMEQALTLHLKSSHESGVELACRHLCNRESLPLQLSAS